MGRPKTTEQNIIRTGKSEAEVTNSKRLRSRYCILLTLTSDRHEASRGLSARAGLLAVTRGRQQPDRVQERTEDSLAQSIHFRTFRSRCRKDTDIACITHDVTGMDAENSNITIGVFQ